MSGFRPFRGTLPREATIYRWHISVDLLCHLLWSLASRVDSPFRRGWVAIAHSSKDSLSCFHHPRFVSLQLTGSRYGGRRSGRSTYWTGYRWAVYQYPAEGGRRCMSLPVWWLAVVVKLFCQDAFSGYEESQNSDTTSLTSSVLNYQYENGRRYHAYSQVRRPSSDRYPFISLTNTFVIWRQNTCIYCLYRSYTT